MKAVHPYLAALALALLSLGAAGCLSRNAPSASVSPLVLAAPEDVEEQIDAEVNLPPVKPFGDSESPSGRARRQCLLEPDGGMPPNLKGVLPGDASKQVSTYVDYFTGAGRERFGLWLSRSTRYAPMMRRMTAW